MGWHYMNPFWRGDDAAEIERIRSAVMKPLTHLTEAVKRGNAKQSIDAVKRFLEDCGAADKLDTFCESIDNAETRGECAYFRQIYEKSLEVLDGIARVYGEAPLDAQTLCDMVKTGFEATKIAVIPPATDEVGVFDISLSRLPGIDVLFAIGVHDGVWPARDDGPGILSAAERDTLMQSGLDTGVYDLSAEKLKVYTALAKPKEKLILSYNTQTGQPSVLIDRMKRLFPKRTVEKAGDSVMSLHGMEADVLGALSDVLRGKTPDDNLLHVASRYLHQTGWRDDAETVLLRTNEATPLDQHTAETLYGGIRCSATRIENYYKCPFRHFLDHGIKAQTPRDYVHDRIDIGTFMHLALDMFVSELIEEQVDIKTLSEAETAARMRQTVSRAVKEHDNAKLLEDERFAMQASILTRELVDTALRIRSHFVGSNAALLASEQSFSFDVPTAFGNVVITGKIDRIDTADGYYRVVDYKSSTVKFALNDFAMGLSLQLPVYIEAARRLLADSDLKPAGGYYMRIGEQYHETADEADKAARMSGISLWDADVLSAFSAVLPGGGFAAVDQALTSTGSVNARGASRLFTQNEMDALLEMSGGLIKDAAEQIYSGATDICPANAEVCQYCNYASVCQFNTEYEGNKLREPKAFDRACLGEEETR
jgi:ATP-dependent helicase/DNAse subunit B